MMTLKHIPAPLNSGSLPTGPGNSNADHADGHDAGFATTTEKPKLQQPPLYKVILILVLLIRPKGVFSSGKGRKD